MGKGIDRSLLEKVIEELEVDWFELAQDAYNEKIFKYTGRHRVQRQGQARALPNV